ncbi:MAG: glucose-6-phosphate dehydrogenase [Gammaproteobacteria bacterium]
MASRVIPVEEFTLAVFGATGDLARRKLYPALWRRLAAGQMPAAARIVGFARNEMSEDAFRDSVYESLQQADAADGRTEVSDNKPLLREWLSHLRYVSWDAAGDEGWKDLSAIMNESPRPLLLYLALSPSLTEPLCARLHRGGFLGGGARLILEKPFGRDLQSARRLNAALESAAAESDIYRIDHYLGKETVQNLMALRFANALFEPAWNSAAVDHVQITVAEDIGVRGRGGYYDRAGAVRDMLQNHLLQLLCLVAMEPPARYAADDVRDEKLKVLKCLRPPDLTDGVAAGQYAGGGGRASYWEDVGRESSGAATFVAVKCMMDNWRWAGTPFYLRTGKRLAARMSEVAVCFKRPPHSVFSAVPPPAQNVLSLRLQPREGIHLRMNIKEPGPGGFRLSEARLDMSFAETVGAVLPDAYERLLMDVVRGDQTLFMRGDELEAAWRWTDPIAEYVEQNPPQPYMCGASGPENALRLMRADGRRWREIV